jgi:hypothetical protein
MHCTLCGKRMSIMNAFRGEKYCCIEHQQVESAERRRLAIQRLMESAPQPREYVGSRFDNRNLPTGISVRARLQAI